MVAKRVSRRKPTKSRVLTVVPELTESGVLQVLESPDGSTGFPSAIDPELRRQMVAAAAYFLAEQRGFEAGHELDDWVAAEAAIDAQLRQALVA